jgi:GntR family transcriptional regulator, transcriptional repressor for pyruvate dehydrogenase complex
MVRGGVIEKLKEVNLRTPSEVIIHQLRHLISDGILTPGDQLPSERELAERFRVGRGYVREALRRLEFYGILKTYPNKGTIVANLGAKALDGLISNILALDRGDLQSLLETRALLEIHSVWLAGQRATDDEIAALGELHERFRLQVDTGRVGLEEDIAFHFKIAECSRNSVLRSLLSLLSPEIIEVAQRYQTCRDGRANRTVEQHAAVLQHLRRRDPDQAASAMASHMQQFLDAVMPGLQFASRDEPMTPIVWPLARVAAREEAAPNNVR